MAYGFALDGFCFSAGDLCGSHEQEAAAIDFFTFADCRLIAKRTPGNFPRLSCNSKSSQSQLYSLNMLHMLDIRHHEMTLQGLAAGSYHMVMQLVRILSLAPL